MEMMPDPVYHEPWHNLNCKCSLPDPLVYVRILPVERVVSGYSICMHHTFIVRDHSCQVSEALIDLCIRRMYAQVERE